MFGALKLQAEVSGPAVKSNVEHSLASDFGSRRSLLLRLPARRLASLSVHSDFASSRPSISSHFTSTVGSSPASLPISRWHLPPCHLLFLNVVACTTAASATLLFCSAIPTLLAFKRAAESLEKLLDVAQQELPDTMVAVRLSGMELSDFTMELSDLGQKINKGVKSSTQAIHLAEERFRWLTNMAPSAPMPEVVRLKTKITEPMVAKTAREVREAVIKVRAIFRMFLTLARFSRMALNYFHV